MKRLRSYLQTPASYATTTVYLTGVALLAATTEGWVPVGFAIIGLTLITALAMVIAAMREVHRVMDLIDVVNRDLLEHMDDLMVALERANRNDGGGRQ